MEYIYAAAYVKSRRLLAPKEFSYLLELSYDEVIKKLSDMGFHGKTPEEIAENNMSSAQELAISLCSEDNLKKIILAENDFHNILTILEAVLTEKNPGPILKSPTSVDTKQLTHALRRKDFSKIQDEPANICEELYDLYKKTKSFEDIKEYIKKEKFKYIKKNGNSFTDGLLYLDNEEEINKYMESTGYSFFDFDCVIAYLWAKELETKNLRLVLYGKSGNMDRNLIEENLRWGYE